MKWLPAIFRRNTEVALPSVENYELEERKVSASERQSFALEKLTDFVTGDGLARVLGGVARSNSAAALLQGLTTHSGRGGLDARTQGQDALEICHLVQKVFAQFEEKLSAQAKGEEIDDTVHDAEEGFRKWTEELKGGD